jgi:hypothetical protein
MGCRKRWALHLACFDGGNSVMLVVTVVAIPLFPRPGRAAAAGHGEAGLLFNVIRT